jgi:hypothetical protein
MAARIVAGVYLEVLHANGEEHGVRFARGRLI